MEKDWEFEILLLNEAIIDAEIKIDALESVLEREKGKLRVLQQDLVKAKVAFLAEKYTGED